MYESLRYLLLQVRNPEDPMRHHEVDCFARRLKCQPYQIHAFDLLNECPGNEELRSVDMVLLGGSGDYSVAEGGDWLPRALDAMREIHAISKPTFASCWGFQALAEALNGKVITDYSRAEVGTIDLHLTNAGMADPIFGPLGSAFHAQMGHHDVVDCLPHDAILLASSDRVENQAYKIKDKPIYSTQFHPELSKDELLDRLRTYPKYVESILGISFDEFARSCRESPEMDDVLPRFVEHVFG